MSWLGDLFLGKVQKKTFDVEKATATITVSNTQLRGRKYTVTREGRLWESGITKGPIVFYGSSLLRSYMTQTGRAVIETDCGKMIPIHTIDDIEYKVEPLNVELEWRS